MLGMKSESVAISVIQILVSFTYFIDYFVGEVAINFIMETKRDPVPFL
jgi:hypothetical protein